MPPFRKTYEVIGYAYEADIHCLDCARARFPNPDQATDNEGNEVHPVFLGDEFDTPPVCVDCFEPLDY